MSILDILKIKSKIELQKKLTIKQDIDESKPLVENPFICYTHRYFITGKEIGESEYLFRPNENTLYLNTFYPFHQAQELEGQKTHISTLAHYESLILIWQNLYQKKLITPQTGFEMVRPTDSMKGYCSNIGIDARKTHNLKQFIEIIREYGNSKGFKF